VGFGEATQIGSGRLGTQEDVQRTIDNDHFWSRRVVTPFGWDVGRVAGGERDLGAGAGEFGCQVEDRSDDAPRFEPQDIDVMQDTQRTSGARAIESY
jgi:hypothetical protein